MSGHTPGPWEVDEANYEMVWSLTDKRGAPGLLYVADCASNSTTSPEYMTEDEIKANARLIAAAPEMLEVLDEFTDAYGNGMELNESNIRKHVNKMIKIIQKAKGEKHGC